MKSSKNKELPWDQINKEYISHSKGRIEDHARIFSYGKQLVETEYSCNEVQTLEPKLSWFESFRFSYLSGHREFFTYFKCSIGLTYQLIEQRSHRNFLGTCHSSICKGR